jgi:hypothetical protein
MQLIKIMKAFKTKITRFKKGVLSGKKSHKIPNLKKHYRLTTYKRVQISAEHIPASSDLIKTCKPALEISHKRIN